MKKLFTLLVFSLVFVSANAQNKISFKDSLDNKFDMSDWVIKAHGFIPVPMLITEPALGNIGGALFGVFVAPNKPYKDSVAGKLITTRVKPNIYAFGGAYTANGSWLLGGMASGVIRKWRSNYRIAAGYADLNLEFYKVIPSLGEQSFNFDMKTIPITGQLLKHFGHSSWYAGVDYLFLNTKLGRTNSDFNTPKEVNSSVSRASILVDYDSRDNVFTPNKGLRWNNLFSGSSDAIGSDYKYQAINSTVFWYVPVSDRLVAAFRGEYQQVFGDIPFYMKPYVNMRGIPIMRYQGNIIGLVETEWRWDFTPRYSVVAFGGTAKAIQSGSSFQDASWRTSGGMGGRYLLARKLKLRVGLDIARGPEDWAYYVVFGTSWNR